MSRVGPTHYECLGVAPDATPDELRAAYRRRARALHPDAGTTASPDAMAALNEAWRVLRDPERRAHYDAELSAVGRPPVGRDRVEPGGGDDGVDGVDGDDGVVWDEAWDADVVDGLPPRRWLGGMLALTLVVMTIVVAALMIYAFTRSGGLKP